MTVVRKPLEESVCVCGRTIVRTRLEGRERSRRRWQDGWIHQEFIVAPDERHPAVPDGA